MHQMISFILLLISLTQSQQVLYTSDVFPYPNSLGMDRFSVPKLLSFNSSMIAFAEGYVNQSSWISYTVSIDLGRSWGEIRTISPFYPEVSTSQRNPVVAMKKSGSNYVITLQYIDLDMSETYQSISTNLGKSWSEGFLLPFEQIGVYALAPNSVVDAVVDNGYIFWTGLISDFSYQKRFRVYKTLTSFDYAPVIARGVDEFGTGYSQITSGQNFLNVVYNNYTDTSTLYYTMSNDKGNTWSLGAPLNITTNGESFSLKKVNNLYVLSICQSMMGGRGNLTIFTSPDTLHWNFYSSITSGPSGDSDIAVLPNGFGVIYQQGVLDLNENILYSAYA